MYINEKNLTKLSAMKRHSMSQFAGREIRLYRSYDKNLVKTYHGNREIPGCYELIMMDYKYGEPRYLIKYPYTNFFVELSGGGGSMNGVHEHIYCSNPIKDIIDPYYYESLLQNQKLEIYRFGERVMLTVDSFRHDFLDQVYGEDILSQEFIKIPDLREISYAYYSPRYGKYLIVDQSEFNFQYETMRLFYGDMKSGLSILPIENFARYRDGGTTHFEFEYEGEKYKFHSPSRLGSDEKKYVTINDSVMSELDENEKDKFLRDLNILHLIKKEIKEHASY
jgi:hypothetical protein